MYTITAENLSKTYPGGNKAVDNISFELGQGEIFGFLGPNGAGKTTTVKMLCGMLSPTGGGCTVYGIDPTKEPERLHQICGIVTEHAQMYDHMTGADNLTFYGTLFGMSRPDCEKRAKELMERLGLAEAQNRKLSAYSTGMRQRLSIARALMHSPKMLFLDEPTSGLDPESAQNVNAMIRRLAKEGTTVFLCTHQLRYAREICTSYGLMNKGNLFAVGDIEKLRAMAGEKSKVRIKTNIVPTDIQCEFVDDGTYDFEIKTDSDIPRIVKKIVDRGGDIYGVSKKEMTLEDIYFSLINSKGVKGRAK